MRTIIQRYTYRIIQNSSRCYGHAKHVKCSQRVKASCLKEKPRKIDSDLRLLRHLPTQQLVYERSAAKGLNVCKSRLIAESTNTLPQTCILFNLNSDRNTRRTSATGPPRPPPSQTEEQQPNILIVLFITRTQTYALSETRERGCTCTQTGLVHHAARPRSHPRGF